MPSINQTLHRKYTNTNQAPNMTKNQAMTFPRAQNGHQGGQGGQMMGYQIQNGHQNGYQNNKRNERVVREAYRREAKMDSYLAEDENYPSFATQLGKLGLHLRDIPGDGNCLFRALGDQLEGHGRNHFKHRIEVTNFMLKERKDFEPFVEDDIPFEVHIQNLRKLGTYAGNDAIVAFARLHSVNIMIHQLGNKPLLIQGSKNPKSRQLHIAYHNGDHYSSVRKMDDNTESPANIQLSESSEQDQHLYPNGYSDHHGNTVAAAIRSIEDIENEVMKASGCSDMKQVKAVLEDCQYDTELAIVQLLQFMELGCGTDDQASVASHQTADSGIWSEGGTGNRIFGTSGTSRFPQTQAHTRGNSFGGSSGYSSISSTRSLGGAIPKKDIKQMTSKEKKEFKKMEKKQRAEDRHRAKFLANNTPEKSTSNVYMIRSTSSSAITRI